MKTETPKTVYLKDYTPPPYLVRHVDLRFDIHENRTVVLATLDCARNPDVDFDDPPNMFLNGEQLELLALRLDGQDIRKQALIRDTGLTLPAPESSSFTLEIETAIVPEKNTALEGLYCSGGTYCTQCEAEGFRKITFFPDRPDVMSTYKVRVEANKEPCPVLLSNGNLVESGTAENGRHYAVFDDPTPKPCYLFALVAGNLEYVHDTFTTHSGTDVDLYIYVRAGDEGQCGHAMESLKKSMKWDEEVYGREYQYDRFNIVAVSDFNMGAMENTSLNIFNTALVLAHPDTATDGDFIRVESVIAHEYFHNWTGNRVTCRDWFQLSLKEGLTVFRDQEFSSDMNARAVQRIDDVMHLRRLQFPEDAGPLAHPVRPDNYMEISNFYTMTVYEKGAEVIRMFHTLLGAETYRKATDLYFDRHDGQAVTCDDWAACMEEASGLDLSQFKLWYSQAGTPEITARSVYDETARTCTLSFSQFVPPTPGQPDKAPMHIPVAVGLIGPNGEDMGETEILHLTEQEQSFTFENIGARPVPSILRNFSAPVKLGTDLSDDDLRFLMIHDSDGFNRWESGQKLALRTLNTIIDAGAAAKATENYIEAYGALLDRASEPEADTALMARALSLPDIPAIAQTRNIVDPEAIHTAQESLRKTIKRTHKDKLTEIYKTCTDEGTFSTTPEAMGRRALRNVVLSLLTATNGTGCAALAEEHYRNANNMTDRMAALASLIENPNAARDDILTDFYERFRTYPLVVDKWFSIQAMAIREDIFKVLESLRAHPDFTLKTPNRVRSLYGAFAMSNPVKFHAPDGSGYDFLKNAVMELNTINPQIAARLLTPLREWRRYTPDRQEKMRAALEEIKALDNLSPDVFEIVSKSLL